MAWRLEPSEAQVIVCFLGQKVCLMQQVNWEGEHETRIYGNRCENSRSEECGCTDALPLSGLLRPVPSTTLMRLPPPHTRAHQL